MILAIDEMDVSQFDNDVSFCINVCHQSNDL